MDEVGGLYAVPIGRSFPTTLLGKLRSAPQAQSVSSGIPIGSGSTQGRKFLSVYCPAEISRASGSPFEPSDQPRNWVNRVVGCGSNKISSSGLNHSLEGVALTVPFDGRDQSRD